MVLKTHVEKFHAILDRHLQKAGLLIKIQLLPCMSEKRTVPGISFHTLKKLNLYHYSCPTQLFEGRYFSVFFSKLKFFHWWNMLMHTPFWKFFFFFFFAYSQSVFAMTTILGFWRMELSLLLLKFIVDVILFCVQIFLFFFCLFLLYRHMSLSSKENVKNNVIFQVIIITEYYVMFSSVQSLSRVRLFATPRTAARQASLSITGSQSLFKLMSIESVMPSNHLIPCRPLLLSPSNFPSIRVFCNESILSIRWPNY